MTNEPTKRETPNQQNKSSEEAARANQRRPDIERQQRQADLQKAKQERGADTAEGPLQEGLPEQDVETGKETPASRISVGPR